MLKYDFNDFAYEVLHWLKHNLTHVLELWLKQSLNSFVEYSRHEESFLK